MALHRSSHILLLSASFLCSSPVFALAPQQLQPASQPQAYASAHLEAPPDDLSAAIHVAVRAPRYRSAFGSAGPEAPAPSDHPDHPTTLTITSSVLVTATDSYLSAAGGPTDQISAREIETSAGTFGDPSRYLQTLAGVVADNDQRNDFLVRGGNPAENLFLIDNIEIPSINQLALSNTTGGLVSMLDAAATQSLTLHTDAYDSRFDQRLSSVVEISTRPLNPPERLNTAEFGIGGTGGATTRPFGKTGSLFFSARQSVLHYFTNDIGMNGVPIYRNAFFRFENRLDDRNEIWGISLTGIDSLKSHADSNDVAETNPYDMSYSGWRNTTGLNLRHIFSPRAFAIASLAYAQQSQSIQQNDQLQADSSVYSEKTADRISTFKLDYTALAGTHATLTAGVRNALDSLNYTVQQPIGLVSPYLASSEPLNVTGFDRHFATGSSAAYAQVAYTLAHNSSLVLGERLSHWALGGHVAAAGKAIFSSTVLGKPFHLSVAQTDQMPATLYLLGFDNLARLKPIHALHFATGLTLVESRSTHLLLNLYEKRYSSYPTALNIPQLSLANIADTFGQAFLIFPMAATGKGLARGAEITLQTRRIPRVDLTGTFTYARNWYSGSDGILRRGNFDIPLSANFSAVGHLPKRLTLSGRFTTTSGHPYTPDDLPASTAQNREIYDLARVNGARSTPYARLDFRFEQAHRLGLGTVYWHVGLQNALNRQNFYSYQWQPRYLAQGMAPQTPATQNQMPLFPDGGLRYTF